MTGQNMTIELWCGHWKFELLAACVLQSLKSADVVRILMLLMTLLGPRWIGHQQGKPLSLCQAVQLSGGAQLCIVASEVLGHYLLIGSGI